MLNGIMGTNHTDCLPGPMAPNLNLVYTTDSTTSPYPYLTGSQIYANGGSLVFNTLPIHTQEKKSVRGLYEVYIVDPEVGDYSKWTTIANNEENARLNAVLDAQKHEQYKKILDRNSIDDLDIIVRFVGAVRPKKVKQE